MHRLKTAWQYARNTVLATAASVGTAVALATPTVPSAADQIDAITTGQSSYQAAMWALALIAVGIMVGVKWIKRGKGAA
jgi:hypothetical protein